MAGITLLKDLLTQMHPVLHTGNYVFVSVANTTGIDFSHVLGVFREKEGTSIILEKTQADQLNLKYDYISSWISLTVHSSLEAVGLTAAISNDLAKEGISCNMVAGYYHDHIFVAKPDAENAMEILHQLTQTP